MSDITHEVKQEVKQFYDQVGWKLVGNDIYQNARYEDLRPVAREYIHKCHLRVGRHLAPAGRFLLDAGSGPVQYPEYLEYSKNYQYRVCADISFTALQEARKRLGKKGLYVVADVANLPFKPGTFDGVVSLHTIHHLEEEEHLQAFGELYRTLAPGKSLAVVNGWSRSPWMNRFEPLIRVVQILRYAIYRLKGKRLADELEEATDDDGSAPITGAGKKRSTGSGQAHPRRKARGAGKEPVGTFTNKHDAQWVKTEVGALMPVEILVWRSVTVRMLRVLIHPRLGGRFWLRRLYNMEENNPHYFGENGKYPLIVIRKPQEGA